MSHAISILITSSALDTINAQDACHFVTDSLATDVSIEQIFFYMDGVDHANSYQRLANDEFNAHRHWHAIAKQHGIPLLVCITSAERRGVIDATVATENQATGHNLIAPFQQVGLGEFFSRLHSSHSLVQF